MRSAATGPVTFAEWKPLIDEIIGETFMPSARLFELAAAVPAAHHIVEVGSYCGKSALTMAAGARSGRGAHVYCVDTWGLPFAPVNPYNVPHNLGYLLMQAEALGLAAQVTPIRMYSAEAAKVRDVGPAGDDLGGWNIGLLFIDAAHFRADLESDMAAWLPHVAPGGHVLFHDYHYPLSPDVAEVIDEWWAAVENHGYYGYWEKVGTIEPPESTWTIEFRRAACAS